MRVPNFLKGSDNLEQYPVVIDFVQHTRLVNVFDRYIVVERRIKTTANINRDQ